MSLVSKKRLGLLAVANAISYTLLTAGCGGVSGADGPGQPGSGGSAAVSGDGGGIGGGGGSAGSGGVSGSVPELIKSYCTASNALPCGKPKCQTEMEKAARDAALRDCTPEFAQLLDCGVSTPLVCVAGKEGPAFDVACDGTLSELATCLSQCLGAASGDGACSISCTGDVTYGAACSPKSSSELECACTAGAETGKLFTLNGTCELSWIVEAKKQCPPL